MMFGIVSSFYYKYVFDEVIFAKATFSLVMHSIGVLAVTIVQSVVETIRSIQLLIGSLKKKQDRYSFPVSLYYRSKIPASQYFFIFLAMLRVLFRYSVGSSCSTYA